MRDEELIEAAKTAAAMAYAPYSKFRVGAVVLAADGSLFTGSNVENAAFPSTLCAEAVAIGSAVSSGVRKIDVIAVACLDGDQNCFPCGQCRQRMREFGTEKVIVTDKAGRTHRHDLSDLLPHSFGPEDLPSP
ncbi:MAG: cytidine deaminase [Acidimicrobiia bacterium]|nr:cytidine deaminase [Acidimicrobiia bacterium]NNF62659.1 cytidine deaminase [Acidimicrobiia bacterium]